MIIRRLLSFGFFVGLMFLVNPAHSALVIDVEDKKQELRDQIEESIRPGMICGPLSFLYDGLCCVASQILPTAVQQFFDHVGAAAFMAMINQPWLRSYIIWFAFD